MIDQHAASSLPPSGTRKSATRKRSAAKKSWRRIRRPLARSAFVKQALASLVAGALRFVRMTNPEATGSHDIDTAVSAHAPAIITMWHGQHLMAPTVRPSGMQVTAMFSRSPDAELNAIVAERFGFEVVRGSGGRERHVPKKGGAGALIALKRALDAGRNVSMIADISHGASRQAGLGVVTLAKVSGRPIVPVAIATSRRRVISRSWDQTTINLPFGRRGVAIGAPVYVPAEADEAAMEACRIAVTAGLDAVTAEAYRLVDGAR